jgi:hypothetical protein
VRTSRTTARSTSTWCRTTSAVPLSSPTMPDSTPPTATRKTYHGTAVEVSFDGARCRHAAECLRGLPGRLRPQPAAVDPARCRRSRRRRSRRSALSNRCTPNPPDHLGKRDAEQAHRGNRNRGRPDSPAR